MNGDIILGIDPGTNLMGYGILDCRKSQPEIMAMGVIDMRKCKDVYEKLDRIHQRVTMLAEQFHPSEMAIEAPFCGINVQSMLKLGRAQGVAIAAAISHHITIAEYAPTKIKMAITGQGGASKEQVAAMLQHIFHLVKEAMLPYLDATDSLGVAYCHYLHRNRPQSTCRGNSWKDFLQQNSNRIYNPTKKMPAKD